MFQATNQTFVLISFILYGDKNKFAGVVVHCASLYKMLFTKKGLKKQTKKKISKVDICQIKKKYI